MQYYAVKNKWHIDVQLSLSTNLAQSDGPYQLQTPASLQQTHVYTCEFCSVDIAALSVHCCFLVLQGASGCRSRIALNLTLKNQESISVLCLIVITGLISNMMGLALDTCTDTRLSSADLRKRLQLLGQRRSSTAVVVFRKMHCVQSEKMI